MGIFFLRAGRDILAQTCFREDGRLHIARVPAAAHSNAMGAAQRGTLVLRMGAYRYGRRGQGYHSRLAANRRVLPFHGAEPLVGLPAVPSLADCRIQTLEIMNFKESRPIYLQIADRIMDEIQRGVYPEGGRIPSVREYAAVVEVNANTAMRSYDYLQNKGIIYNKRGIGYFVAEGAAREVLELRRAEFLNEELPEMLGKIRALGIPFAEIEKKWRDGC